MAEPWQDQFDVEEIRARIQKMSDKDLERTGRAAQYLCSPEANRSGQARAVFVVQLRECREEWKRRHDPRGIGRG